MDFFFRFKILKYGFIFCLLSQLTTAVNDDEVDVPLLDTQNAPLFATLDLSKANRRIKAHVFAAVKAQIGGMEEKLKEYISDIEKNASVSRNNELRIVVENVLKEKAIPHECADINFSKDGVFLIYPSGAKRPKYAYCVLQDNRRWTVFQRRSDPSVSFYKWWSDYREGFGDSSGTHWLGNDYIHGISTFGRHRARFILEKDGIKKYADYSNFRVGDEHSKYMLNVSGYSGTAGNPTTFSLRISTDHGTNTKKDFGRLPGEHWLGNKFIHSISTNGRHRVKFIFGKDGTKKYAEYSNFLIKDEKSKYKLKVSGYSGTAGDSIDSVDSQGRANGQKFSTYDRDNDSNKKSNCAIMNEGGWWYNSCDYASLNDMESYKISWYFHMGFHLDTSIVRITKV